MANTYTLIQSVTVGSGGAANIEFTSIPQTYTDLVVVASLDQSVDEVDVFLQFNGSTSSLSSRNIRAVNGTVTSSAVGTDIRFYGGSNPTSYTASVFSSLQIYVPNYAGSTNKSVSADYTTENNSTNHFMGLTAGLWANTAAITSLKLLPFSGASTFIQYSSASLYGIKNS